MRPAHASLLITVLLAALAPSSAGAQDEPAAAEAAAPVVEAFGSWALRCAAVDAAQCDVVQVLHDRESGARVVSVSIAHAPAQAMSAIQIAAPLGVHLPTGLTIIAGELTVAGVRFTRCELQGCVVEARLGDDMLEAMRAAPSMRLGFGIDAERTASIDVALDGFSEAYDALLARTAESGAAEPE